MVPNTFAAIEALLAVEWLGVARIPVDPTASPDVGQKDFCVDDDDLMLVQIIRAAIRDRWRSERKAL